MAETKYGKYFVSGGPYHLGGPVIARIDDTVLKGCHFNSVHWNLRYPNGVPGVTEWGTITHGPHSHKDGEQLVFIGMDPENPYELGAEVELCMGPEMEKHTITKSTFVYIPPNLVHCPYTIKKIDKPFMFLQILQGPIHTEKPHKDLVPEKDRDKMIFFDKG